MFGPSSIYALDIETDTSGGGGLDPAGARITEIAVKVDESLGGGEVFNDTDEIALLTGLESYLASLKPGLIATWNGSFFDLPFIDDRRKMAAPSLTSGLVLTYDPELKPKYEPLPGHPGGYSAVWGIGAHGSRYGARGHHQHLDISLAYKKFAYDLDEAAGRKPGKSWSLKPVCKAHGIDMIEIDRENAHLYTPEERKAYCLSDGHGTRELALRLLGLA